MKIDDIRRLYAFDRWATEEQHRVICTLDPEKYQQDLGSSHGGIHGTLVHIYGAQRIWLDRWNGEAPTALPRAEHLHSLTLVMNAWEGLRADLETFMERSTDEQLAATFAYKSLAGDLISMPLWQQMQHVVNHSTYHRGQITTMLRQLGVAAVGIDLIAYYRLVR